MKLSENLKNIRKDNNLSQEQLAEKLGVSRQAVSKWESGQSYPEMDKVLLICKLFNYKIDELMNENVKEVEEIKQSKNNVNKFIEDFLGYITKTVDMFSAMKCVQKIKCILELLFLAIVLVCIFGICGEIILLILGKLFGSFFYYIENIMEAFYLIFSLITGITILLHIFKIRYLDYYEIVKTKSKNIEIEVNQLNEDIEKKENQDDNKKKIFLQKEKEKIIIRDPEHSQSKFLSGLMNVILCFLKAFAITVEMGFCLTFIVLIAVFVLNFLFIKTGIVFIGSLLGIISAILINFSVLEITYNFIFSKKLKRKHISILLIISLLLAGLGIGLFLIGLKDFNFTNDYNTANLQEKEFNIKMRDNLSFSYYSRINYIEAESDDIKIIVNHSKYSDVAICDNSSDIVDVYTCNFSINQLINDIINDINNKKIKNYEEYMDITVYTSKDNIEKLKQNTSSKYESMISYESEIDSLYRQNEELQNQIYDLESTLNEKNEEIQDLEIMIDDYKNN